MNLVLFFRLITMSIFQSMVTYDKLASFRNEQMSYKNQMFHCPLVVAVDGFSVSLQIHNGNYCSSVNGYRELGHTMVEVEFGFPSMNEELMFQYSEMWSDNETDFDVTGTVGRIPITVIEDVFAKHGGIDWEKTISIEQFNNFLKND